jgi:hypothetical protein
VDFNAVTAGTDPTRRFIADDRAVANIIRGNPQQPGPNDKGHFHLGRRSSGSFSRADSLPHWLASGLPRRSGDIVCAEADVAPRLPRSDTDVHAAGDERVPGSAAQLGTDGGPDPSLGADTSPTVANLRRRLRPA